MADAEKQFSATPRKKKEARNKGQVARSNEVNSVLVLIGALLALRLAGPMIMRDISSGMVTGLTNINYTVTAADVIAYLPAVLMMFLKIVAPVMLVCMVFGVTANLVQFGFLFTGQPLLPKLSKINPATGFGRIFSKRTVVELVKSVLKIVIIGGVAWMTLRGQADLIFAFMDMESIQVFTAVCNIAFVLFLRICLVLVALALADYLYQRWDHDQELKMTRQEMKDEMKRTEGDPMVRQRIRQLQRQLANQRMMSEVPKADVVITNPTRLAIAIRYAPDEKDTPYVVAKGERLMAQRIRDIAREHGVPIVENKPLAQVLYKAVEVGMEVPSKFYRGVAEILAYVYRLKGKV